MFLCDGFLNDAPLLEALRDKELWGQSAGALRWWDGWWKSSPANPIEETIQRVWKGQVSENEIAGFEYWFNALTEGQSLKWHRDSDLALHRREGRFVCPALGNVFYVIVENVVGGFMELSDQDSLIDIEISDLQRIRPVENRLVIFNPSYWHRVTRLARGKRLALQTNLWTQKPNTFALGDHVDQNLQPIVSLN